jgi:hypothetical protein
MTSLQTDFRHAGLASPGPYRMNAAFMRLERRERGIHVKGLAGRDRAVTGVHERLCGTTARRVRPFTIKNKFSGIALEQRKCRIHIVRA